MIKNYVISCIAVIILSILTLCSIYPTQCNRKVEVKIIDIRNVPYSAFYQTPNYYVVVETVKTKERYIITGYWGNSNDVFFISSKQLQ